MARAPFNQAEIEEIWRSVLTTGEPPSFVQGPSFNIRELRRVMGWVPTEPRCELCHLPFKGIGGALARTLFGRVPSKMNPHMCNSCELFAEKHHGGAEIELSMLFADVRGSTTLAEKQSPAAFSRLISRFYTVTTHELIHANALIEKLIGDEVTGLFVPGLAGPAHAKVAIKAAQAILAATGHGAPAGPWIPVGVGVHTGTAYVGSVGQEGGMTDITALGDAVNTAARLASQAAAGEILLSETARVSASLPSNGLESRHLQLKGRSEPILVWVLYSPATPNEPALHAGQE